MIEAIINSYLFRPTTSAECWETPPAGLAVEDVELPLADGTRIHGWWAAPAGWSPGRGAVLYCHGNAGNVSTRGESLQRWRDELGLAVILFDYPGYGRSGGRPSEAGCHTAAATVYDWLIANQRVPAERILLYGGSLGGAVAAALAAKRSHRALALLAAFTSVADMARAMFGMRLAGWLAGGRFDTLTAIGRTGRPVFVAHGTADEVVPFPQGEQLFAAANGPKQFLPLHGHDHHHPAGEEFFAGLRRFLQDSAP